jgi:hypothetical protein
MESRKQSAMILKDFPRNYFKRSPLQENVNNSTTVKGAAEVPLQGLSFQESSPPMGPSENLTSHHENRYLWQIRSSRRLESECKRNVEVMWLLGRLAPDYKSIAEFRRMHREAGSRGRRGTGAFQAWKRDMSSHEFHERTRPGSPVEKEREKVERETPSLSLRLRSVHTVRSPANATRKKSNRIRGCSNWVRSSFERLE